jgi:hypothetical protein
MKKLNYEQIYNEAEEAGRKALALKVPTPMVVQTHENMLDDNSKVVYSEVVDGGVCGFAWVKVKANTSFGSWLRTVKGEKLSYTGGYDIWVREGGQSMERKEAFAEAFAEVLTKYGIEAYAESRMD